MKISPFLLCAAAFLPFLGASAQTLPTDIPRRDGEGQWLSASRHFGTLDLDVFASDDDALTRQSVTTLDVKLVNCAEPSMMDLRGNPKPPDDPIPTKHNWQVTIGENRFGGQP